MELTYGEEMYEVKETLLYTSIMKVRPPVREGDIYLLDNTNMYI